MAGPFKKKEKDGNIMGKIYYVMGKSASGKDTIYKRLVKELPELGTVRMYTTRPIRDGETNGVEYIFTDGALFMLYICRTRILIIN